MRLNSEDTVNNPQATVQAIREWLTVEFSGSTVNSQNIFDKETELFRVHVAKGHQPELEVSREILERQATAAVLKELKESDSIERMKRDPSVRIQYFDSGIHHFETRYVRCDDNSYRVVRDEKHNVTIYDSADRRLSQTPKTVLNLPASIFQVSADEWCSRIRTWRGEGQ